MNHRAKYEGQSHLFQKLLFGLRGYTDIHTDIHTRWTALPGPLNQPTSHYTHKCTDGEIKPCNRCGPKRRVRTHFSRRWSEHIYVTIMEEHSCGSRVICVGLIITLRFPLCTENIGDMQIGTIHWFWKLKIIAITFIREEPTKRLPVSRDVPCRRHNAR